MMLTDKQKQNYKQEIINRFNDKCMFYVNSSRLLVSFRKILTLIQDTNAAQEVAKLRDDKLDKLDQAAQVQLDYNNRVSKDSLTVREILELERNGTTTVD